MVNGSNERLKKAKAKISEAKGKKATKDRTPKRSGVPARNTEGNTVPVAEMEDGISEAMNLDSDDSDDEGDVGLPGLFHST
jgi:hypothetical protein